MGRVREIVRRGRIGRSQVVLCCAAVCGLMVGCQTSRSFSDGCPGIYSGVRYYNSQITTMPWDGRIFFAFDLPFSAILDTLVLPGTAFADPVRPPAGWVPGCAWVDR